MGAASFKSLYQKRPSESVQMRDVSRGAPDTALRLPVPIQLSRHQCGLVWED